MTWALVLGGAKVVFDEARAAIAQFGEPDQIVAVKDIWMEWPKVDHVVSYHADRWPRELVRRRKLGFADPPTFWTYRGVRVPRMEGIDPSRIKYHDVRGGSSGLLGALVGIEVCDRAVLAGIPIDVNQRHFHDRKKGKPWAEGHLYKKHWLDYLPKMKGRVKSMSGYTMELLGAPTVEWVRGDKPSADRTA
jgi:hypothetical protein